MEDSPAYRLNHEEITKFFEEGVRFIEKLSPLACVPDERGALKAVEFERLESVDGELQGDRREGDAAGAQPVRRGRHARPTSPTSASGRARSRSIRAPRRFKALPRRARRRTARCAASRRTASEVGLLHRLPPRRAARSASTATTTRCYAGSVVRAMASAKDGAPHVEALFARRDRRRWTPADQPARDAAWQAFAAQARRRAARRRSCASIA